uniref:Uncharacterized protein n=1 Tax=Anguilla anguilla TaxID=7936 RepID=A0A0E9PLW5_ANGAN
MQIIIKYKLYLFIILIFSVSPFALIKTISGGSIGVVCENLILCPV